MRELNAICRFLIVLAVSFFLGGRARAATSVSFTNPIFIPTSEDVLVLSTADLNNDGKADLVYLDGTYSSRAVHVLLGNGDGTFRHVQDVTFPGNACCGLAIADVTGDGVLDIIVAGSDQFQANISVLVGNGDGTFQQPLVTSFQPPNISGYPGFRYPAAVGDVNGDGKMDLVLADVGNGTNYILLGNNSGQFTYSASIQTYQTGPTYLVDLNGDHILDLVATDPLGAEFLVYLGKAGGSFPSFTRYTAGTAGGPFLLADVNQDGHPDILFDYYPNQLGYFPGNPDGTFSAWVALGNAPSPDQLVSATDLNGDGAPDLTFITPSGVAVALGKSGPSYGPAQTTITGGSANVYSMLPVTPVVADFNGDGHSDFAMAAEGGIAIFLGHGDGTFSSVEFYDMGQEVGSAAVGNFSGHGFQDIAVSLPAPLPRLLLGSGTGTFTLGADPNSSYASAGAAVTLLPGDFNGDGKPDLNIGSTPIYESSSGTDSVAINAGNGSFETPVSVPNSSPVMADFNGDGRTDMISVTGEQIVVSLGQANGTFVAVNTPIRVPSGYWNVGDVNRDGKPDVILSYPDHFEVWLGNGDGTFTYSNSFEVPGLSTDFLAAITDLDGDGNADLIFLPNANFSTVSGPLAILYGNGDGTFGPPAYLALSRPFPWITVADLNADHLPDLVLTDGAGIAVITNLGSRQFGPETDYIAGRSVSVPVSVADVNGDGLPDIIVGNSGGTTVTVLLNQSGSSTATGVSGNLTLSPDPSNYLSSFTATLAVAGQSTGAPTPTGSVSFSVDDEFVTTNPMSGGSASWTEPAQALIPGQHTITAEYNGDANYSPKVFSSIQTIQPPVYATRTALTVAPSSVLAGQTVHLTAAVTATPLPPGGVITFYDGPNSLGSAQIDSQGVAYRDTSLLSGGTHTLTAAYQGFTQTAFTPTDATYTAAIFTPSVSSAVMLTVATDATVTTLSPSNTSPTAGTVVTFTANVSSSAAAPFGGVTFYDGTTLLGALGLASGGTAAFSTASLATGQHTITAVFSANGPFAASTSAGVTVNVAAAPAGMASTIVSLSQQIDGSTGGSTLSAEVGGGPIVPTGTVTFLDSGTILGTAEIGAGGMATRAVGALSSGPHRFTASFAGNAEYSPSVSPELDAQWPQTGPGFALTLWGVRPRVTSSTPITIEIQGTRGFAQQVQLECAGGVPQGYVCRFSPSTVGDRGVSKLTIVPEQTNDLARTSGAFFAALVIACFFLLDGRYRTLQALILLLALCGLGAIAGCNTAPPRDGQTVVVTISATSGSGPNAIVHSTQIQFTPRSN